MPGEDGEGWGPLGGILKEVHLTYRIEGSSVRGELDDLDGGVITRLNGHVLWQRQLREADGARVRVIAGTEDLKWVYDRKGHVDRTPIGTLGAETHIDVDEGRGMTPEPTGLEGKGATCGWPVGTVLCEGRTAA